MKRVLFLSPADTDSDVDRHADALEASPDVDLIRQPAPAEDTLGHLIRATSALFRTRSAADVLVTVGAPALTAASVAWRGPLIHIIVGKLTRYEASLSRSLASRPDFRLVTSSQSIARHVMMNVASVGQVRVIQPAAAPPTMSREEARSRLGLSHNTAAFLIPGRARPGSGHRLSLWTSSILIFRDASARALMRSGGPGDAFVRRFAKSSQQTQALIAEDNLNDADRALAADAALCMADRAPDWSALAACRDAGTPIIAPRSTWQRERLYDIPATLVDVPQARQLARAAIEAFEHGRLSPPSFFDRVDAQTAWSDLFAGLSTPVRRYA